MGRYLHDSGAGMMIHDICSSSAVSTHVLPRRDENFVRISPTKKKMVTILLIYLATR